MSCPKRKFNKEEENDLPSIKFQFFPEVHETGVLLNLVDVNLGKIAEELQKGKELPPLFILAKKVSTE